MRVTGKPSTPRHYFHELWYNYNILQPLKNAHVFLSCEKGWMLERISSRQSAISQRLAIQI